MVGSILLCTPLCLHYVPTVGLHKKKTLFPTLSSDQGPFYFYHSSYHSLPAVCGHFHLCFTPCPCVHIFYSKDPKSPPWPVDTLLPCLCCCTKDNTAADVSDDGSTEGYAHEDRDTGEEMKKGSHGGKDGDKSERVV